MVISHRTAAKDDTDLLTAMNIRLRADEKMDNVMTEDQVRQRMIRMLDGAYTALIFTAEGGAVAGYTLTDRSRTPMYLRQLYVEPDFRRMGLGRRMIDATMQHLDARELDIEVMAWNESARAFYKRIGCRERYVGLRYSPDPRGGAYA